MSQIPSTLKEKRRFWLSHLEAWRDSGLSMAGYARQAGISSKSLGYWHGKTRPASAPRDLGRRPGALAGCRMPRLACCTATCGAATCCIPREGRR